MSTIFQSNKIIFFLKNNLNPPRNYEKDTKSRGLAYIKSRSDYFF